VNNRFYLGWEAPARGAIFLDHHRFANIWQHPADYPVAPGKWVLNREAPAIKLGVPNNLTGFESPDAIIEYLEAWLRATGS